MAKTRLRTLCTQAGEVFVQTLARRIALSTAGLAPAGGSMFIQQRGFLPSSSWACNPEGCPFKDIDDAPGDLVPALRKSIRYMIGTPFLAHQASGHNAASSVSVVATFWDAGLLDRPS